MQPTLHLDRLRGFKKICFNFIIVNMSDIIFVKFNKNIMWNNCLTSVMGACIVGCITNFLRHIILLLVNHPISIQHINRCLLRQK
jgi:hypothetical protein